MSKKEMEEKLKEIDKKLSDTEKKLSKTQVSVKSFNDMCVSLKKLIDTHEKKIKEQTSLLENVDCTLGNVLLAIRQNEYLQAWYPEQSGYPEMKVTGYHPKSAYAKKEGKNERK